MGSVLARRFHEDGHDVVVLSRSPKTSPWKVVPWDGKSVGAWASELEGADVVLNLAGRSVDCRYNARNRREITSSRLDSTNAIGRAISQASNPPRVWLQASTATIYAHRFDAANDEASGIIGGNDPDVPETWNFSLEVATSWERAAMEANVPKTRLVLLRASFFMSPDSAAFRTLLRLVRLGLGGHHGTGRQYTSWIHHDDFLRALYFIIDRDHITGPVNFASPNPVPNDEFMRGLRRAWGSRFGLATPRWMLEFGAVFLRTETELILKSRRVVPGVLSREGFTFQHPHWPQAARALVEEWRRGRSSPSRGLEDKPSVDQTASRERISL
jgi:hypothetical protein